MILDGGWDWGRGGRHHRLHHRLVGEHISLVDLLTNSDYSITALQQH